MEFSLSKDRQQKIPVVLYKEVHGLERGSPTYMYTVGPTGPTCDACNNFAQIHSMVVILH